MKIITFLIIIMLLISTNIYADITGLPFTDAQYAHLLGGAYLSEVLQTHDIGIFEQIVIVSLLATCKEMYDQSHGFKFDTDDILWSAGGVVLAYSIRVNF